MVLQWDTGSVAPLFPSFSAFSRFGFPTFLETESLQSTTREKEPVDIDDVTQCKELAYMAVEDGQFYSAGHQTA